MNNPNNRKNAINALNSRKYFKATTDNIHKAVGRYLSGNPDNLPPIGEWDVSEVKYMNNLFKHADKKNVSKFNESLNSWNVINVKDMSYMFYNAESFNQPLEQWNVSNVNDMGFMFSGATSFNQPLEKWDVSNVNDMAIMFYTAESFNQPLEQWNVSNVNYMGAMFSEAISFNQPLERWNVSNVTNMGEMFSGADMFNQPLEKWNVSNVNDMGAMFSRALLFNQPLEQWNVSNVTDMGFMFNDARNFNQPLNNWNISNVTSMRYMFNDARNFNQPLNNWNVANLEDVVNRDDMFRQSGISHSNLPTFPIQPPIVELPAEIVNNGQAFQVHNAFNNINFNRLLDLINNGTVVNTPIHENFNQFMNNELQTILKNYTTKSDSEELTNKFKSLLSKINVINYKATDFKITGNPTPESVFLTIIKFIKEQPKQYQDNYIKMFIDESYSAYNTGADQISCVKGIKERIIFALGQAGFNLDNPLYKQISETLFPIEDQNIYAFISRCIQENQQQLETLGDNLEGKKTLITNCLIQKIRETYSGIDLKMLEDRISKAINASQDMFGGRKRRKMRKTKKRITKRRKMKKTKRRKMKKTSRKNTQI
jgi:surface protein